MAGWWAVPSASRLRSLSLYVDTNEVEDLVKAGIIDPTMVTRSALQNAASIAKNILTTEAIVAEPLEQAGAGSNPEGRQLDADRELALLALPHQHCPGFVAATYHPNHHARTLAPPPAR